MIRAQVFPLGTQKPEAIAVLLHRLAQECLVKDEDMQLHEVTVEPVKFVFATGLHNPCTLEEATHVRYTISATPANLF